MVMRSQGMSQSFGPAERLSEVMALQRPGAGAPRYYSGRTARCSVHSSPAARIGGDFGRPQFLCGLADQWVAPLAAAAGRMDRSKEAIRSFEDNDRKDPPPKRGVALLESSSL